MHCHQVIPGTVNSGLYQYCVGSVHDDHFIAYASCSNIIILDTNFDRIQTIPQADKSRQISCVTCTRETGLIGASCGNEVKIYAPCRRFIRPSSLTQTSNYEWDFLETVTTSHPIWIISWSPDGENMLISLQNNTLEFWTKNGNSAMFSVDYRSNRSWTKIWQNEMPSKVELLEFSPNGRYFVTASFADCIARVWYREEDLSSEETIQCVFLPHPSPVVYVRWRCNSRFLYNSDRLANCLLTVAKDGICRIWSDKYLHEEDDLFLFSNDSKGRQRSYSELGTLHTALKIRKKRLIDHEVLQLKQDEHRFSLHRHFHRRKPSKIKRYIDAFGSIASLKSSGFRKTSSPVVSTTSLNDDSKSLRSIGSRVFLYPMQVHSFFDPQELKENSVLPVNPVMTKHNWSLVGVIDPTGVLGDNSQNANPVCMHWLDNKEFNFTLMSEQLMLNVLRDFNLSMDDYNRRRSSFSDTEECEEITDKRTFKRGGLNKLFRSMSENEVLEAINKLPEFRCKNLKKHGEQFEQMIKEICEKVDFLFCFDPSDGSFLIWMIESLDEVNRGSILCRSSLLSKLTAVMNPVAAGTLGRSVRLFYDINFVAPRISATKSRSVSLELSLPTGLRIITKHTNGTLNLWEVQFADKCGNGCVTAINHIKKLCGHRLHLTEVRSHPVLPLVLTTSNSESENGLIVWQVETCGPLLSRTGGINALDKIYAERKGAFSLVAWFQPVKSDNKPDACAGGLFVAFDGQEISIYHVSRTEYTQCELEILPGGRRQLPSRIRRLSSVSNSKKFWSDAWGLFLMPSHDLVSLDTSEDEDDHSNRYHYLILAEHTKYQTVLHSWLIDTGSYFDPNCAVADACFISEKLNSSVLPIPASCGSLMSIAVAAHFLNAAFMSPLLRRCPVHCACAFQDGSVWLLSCFKDKGQLTWQNCNGNRKYSYKVDGVPLTLKSAYSGRYAVVYIPNSCIPSKFGEVGTNICLKIDIIEAESSAGLKLQLEDQISVPEITIPKDYRICTDISTVNIRKASDGRFSDWPQYKKHRIIEWNRSRDDLICLDSYPYRTDIRYINAIRKLVFIDWGPSGDGSHILSLAVGQHLFFFCRNRMSIDKHLFKWTLLRHGYLDCHDGLYPLPVQIKWIRSGLLLVGLQTEMQLLSPWIISHKSVFNLRQAQNKLTNCNTSTVPFTSFTLNPTTFGTENLWEYLRQVMVTVQAQYNHNVLVALISTGQIRWAFLIMDHLRACLSRKKPFITPVPLSQFLRDEMQDVKIDKVADPMDWLSMPVSWSLPSEEISQSDDNRIDKRSLEELLAILQEVDISWVKPELDRLRLIKVIRAMLFVSSTEDTRTGADDFAERFRFFFAYHLEHHDNASWRVSTRAVAWAHFCQSQEYLIYSVLQGNKITWELLRQLRVVLWLTDLNQLRDLIEKAARSNFETNNDPLDSALFYILLGKTTLLANLFKLKQDKRMYEFLTNPDIEQRNVVAVKNACLLLRNHRYLLAIALFLLADKIDTAIDICLNRIDDKDLATLIVRLRPELDLYEFLDTHYLKCTNDPFIRSVCYSLCGKSKLAVNELMHPAPGYIDESSVSIYLAICKNSRGQDFAQPLYRLAYKHLSAGKTLLALNALLLARKVGAQSKFQDVLIYKVALRILTMELQVLSGNFETSDKCLRNHFLVWFEGAVRLLNTICGYHGALPEEYPNNQWLQRNEVLLRVLLAFCMVHSCEPGYDDGIDTVKVEILYLLSEMNLPMEYQPYTLRLPPLIRLPILYMMSVSKDQSEAVKFSHITAFHELTRRSKSILLTIGGTKTLPSIYNSFAYRVASLMSESSNLSDAVFQSLLISKPRSDYAALLSLDYRSERVRQFSFNVPDDDESCSSYDQDDRPRPADWPGISLTIQQDKHFPASIANHLRCALFEALVACYLALIACALTVLNAEQLRSIMSVRWDENMWADLFGYGDYSDGQDQEGFIQGTFHPPVERILSYFLKSCTATKESSEANVLNTSTLCSEPCCKESSDPSSYSWCLLRLAILTLARKNIAKMMSLLRTEPHDLVSTSPEIVEAFHALNMWARDSLIFYELSEYEKPAILNELHVDSYSSSDKEKYKSMLQKEFSPFCEHAVQCSRLWFSLIENEILFDIFVQCLYKQKEEPVQDASKIQSIEEVGEQIVSPSKVVYKDQDCINCFVTSQVDSGILALSNGDQIIELDITHMFADESVHRSQLDLKFDVWSFDRYDNRKVDLADFLLIRSSVKSSSNLVASMHLPQSTSRFSMLGMRHDAKGVRALDSHPNKPHYACGLKDGSALIYFWGKQNAGSPICISQTARKNSPITSIHFDPDGHRVGIMEEVGALQIFQLAGDRSTCYLDWDCHCKQANSFVFLQSATMLVTAGHNNDGRNVAIWDTLLPKHKARVSSFYCHEGGALAVKLFGNTIATSGRRGEIYLFDIRQRSSLSHIQAHDSAIKAICFNSTGSLLISGSAEGNIKVWNTANLSLAASVERAHVRSSLIKGARTGVTEVFMTDHSFLLSSGYDGSLQCRQITV